MAVESEAFLESAPRNDLYLLSHGLTGESLVSQRGVAGAGGGRCADSVEKHEPASDIDAAVVNT